MFVQQRKNRCTFASLSTRIDFAVVVLCVAQIFLDVNGQVESCGAKFLEVKTEEDGSGSGGYAKEMSPGMLIQMNGAQGRNLSDFFVDQKSVDHTHNFPTVLPLKCFD